MVKIDHWTYVNPAHVAAVQVVDARELNHAPGGPVPMKVVVTLVPDMQLEFYAKDFNEDWKAFQLASHIIEILGGEV